MGLLEPHGRYGDRDGEAHLTILVRRLTESDVDDYRTIRLETLRTEPDSFSTLHDTEAARPRSDFAGRLASGIVLGAYDERRIVGVVALRPASSPKERHKGTVTGFFVTSTYRRQGVASALMTALVEAAMAQVEQLTLAVVEGNAGAIALYERWGFSIYGREPRALKSEHGYVDRVLMSRRL